MKFKYLTLTSSLLLMGCAPFPARTILTVANDTKP